MFENLIESSNKGSKSFGQSIASLIIHGVVIFAAVAATKGAAEEIKQRVIDTTLVFLKPPEPPPPPPPPPPQDVVVSANPPPKGFQTIVPPDIIPKDIPPIDLNTKPFDPKDFSGKGVEGGISAGIEGGTGPVLGQVFLTSQLDDPAQRISGPPPRYPPVMASAGIAGSVDLQFIIDTTGHVEPGSLKVIAKTHDAFVEPAKEAIQKSIFKPARYKGEPVRQQVQQRVSFTSPN